MGFNHDELVLINKALLYYKSVLYNNSQVECIQAGINNQRDLILLNQLLEKLKIELFEEAENNNVCDDCQSHITENGDIFIDRHSFKVDKSMVVCCNCYENKYKELYI